MAGLTCAVASTAISATMKQDEATIPQRVWAIRALVKKNLPLEKDSECLSTDSWCRRDDFRVTGLANDPARQIQSLAAAAEANSAYCGALF